VPLTELPVIENGAGLPPDRAPDRAGLPVVLVSMPFMDVNRPSIQLGLLKAVVERHGFPVRTLHANLDFAARLGVDGYRRLADHRGRLVGDWLFALARRLKRRRPDLVTVFGGANFDGDMGAELMRTADCADYAVIGEAEVAFPRLLDALAAGTRPGPIPGVARRTGAEVTVTPPAPPARHLDDQLRLLAQAGVRHIQPGLESLSSNVLRLMRKGIRAAQNVNLLRWSRYYGIDVAWNILWGFPGETDQDYAEQTAAVPDLAHLQPPENAGRIWMERFSPLFTEPGAFGVRGRTAEASYRYIYPDTADVDRIAYFFDYETTGTMPEPAYEPLRTAVGEWSAAWAGDRKPALTYRSAPGFLQVYDGSAARERGHLHLRG
jgi:Radical SAM superfamily